MAPFIESELWKIDDPALIICTARQALHLSIADVARSTRISKEMFSEIEKGKTSVPLEKAHFLGAALNIDGAQLKEKVLNFQRNRKSTTET